MGDFDEDGPIRLWEIIFTAAIIAAAVAAWWFEL